MVSSKVDGRACRISTELKFDKLEVTTEKRPATALTVPARDQLAEGVDMSDSTDTRKAISLDYLHKVAADLTKTASLRVQYVLNARRYGATNQEIGDALGITETAVRRMVIRHTDYAEAQGDLDHIYGDDA